MRLPETNFDIYQTENGYTAVTNDVRRLILEALAQQDRGLPDLVKITGKAKPTLSSVHMKELLAQRLVEELAHPTDNRKKIYRLRARRIGSSTIPVEQLRSAVRQYAGTARPERLALAPVFDALCAAPPDTPDPVLHAQATRLGELTRDAWRAEESRDIVTSVAAHLEQEGLARPMRLDLENRQLELELAPAFPADADARRLSVVAAGYVQGVLRARGLDDLDVEGAPLRAPRRFELRLLRRD